MPWFWQPSAAATQAQRQHHSPDPDATSSPAAAATDPDHVRTTSTSPLLRALGDPVTLLSTALLTSSILGATYLYRTRLRRVPNADHLRPSTLHSSLTSHPHSLFGRIVTVPDGDGLRFYHTPGGRWAMWGSLRTVPTAPFPRAERGSGNGKPHARSLTEQTISVRMSGIDAPEGAHFGKPAQPFSTEALDYLRLSLLGRSVRLYPHSKDQYGRVVGTVLARPWGGVLVGLPRSWQRDVGLEMVQRGLATLYEAKFGSEFGGKEREQALRRAQEKAQADRRGMWALDRGHGRPAASSKAHELGLLRRLVAYVTGRRSTTPEKSTFETPREYKQRMAGSDGKTSDGAK